MNLRKDLRAVGSRPAPWQTINMLMELHPRGCAKIAGMGSESLRDSLGKLVADLSAVEERFSVKSGPRGNESKKHENFTNNFLISYVEGEDDEARRNVFKRGCQFSAQPRARSLSSDGVSFPWGFRGRG